MCSPCPAGYSCPSISDPSLNKPCSPGYYSTDGDSNCNPCSAGQYCPNTTMAQGISCSPGTYSKSAATSCSPCPLGWKCPFADGHGNTECTTVSTHNNALPSQPLHYKTVGNIFIWKLLRVFYMSGRFLLSNLCYCSSPMFPWNICSQWTDSKLSEVIITNDYHYY